MSCQKIQRRLFTLSNPERVPASVRNHLAECPACREVQRRLAQIERAVPLLAVPASPFAKAALLKKVRSGPTFRDRVVRYVEQVPAQLRQSRRWQLAGAGLAAALMLIVIGWQLGTGPNGTPVAQNESSTGPDTFLASVVERQLTLAETGKPDKQAEALGGLADDLHGAARTLARASEPQEVRELSAWYEKVVQKEVSRAARVPAAERKAVLGPLAERLDTAAKQADTLALDMTNSAEALRGMAAAARKGSEDLKALSRQEASLWPSPEWLGRPALGCAVVGRTFVRHWELPGLTAGAAAAARADKPAGPTPQDEARAFKRNRDLIQVVVDESLALADASKPMERARSCGQVARKLAEAAQKAADDRESARVAELGEHLRNQMQRGVADNLKAAAADPDVPSASNLNRDMLEVARKVNSSLVPLEEQLARASDPQMQRALTALHDGRAQIEKVLEARKLSLEPGKENQPEIKTVP